MSQSEIAQTDVSPESLEHLTKDSDRITSTSVRQADLTSREYWCLECNRKVTRSPTRDGEYGHRPNCPYTVRRQDWHGLEPRGEPR